jgi:hypothetical protein
MDAMLVGKGDVKKVWSQVEPMLLGALKKNIPLWNTDDVLEAVMKDEMQLWIAYDDDKQTLLGSVITQIMVYPRGKLVNVFLLGGNNIKMWKDKMAEKIEKFAREEGCAYLQAIGRKGWQPLFPDMFEVSSIIIKVLD